MDKTIQKKVSIIIPCYNADEYLIECLDSIFNQTIDKSLYEVIIIDDKSTDDSFDILTEYEKKYPNDIVFIPLEEHIGKPGVARNIAMQYARGTFIMFADSDDLLESDCLEIMVDKIEKTNCDIVSCGYSMFDKDGEIACDNLENIEYDLSDINNLKLLFLSEGNRTSAWGRIYRKDFLIDHNIHFSEDYHIAEDMFFWHNAMLNAQKTISIEPVLYRYRVKSDSIFHSLKTNYSLDIVHCCKEIGSIILNNKKGSLVREEYSAVLFVKCINELFGYLDERSVTEKEFEKIVVELVSAIEPFANDLRENNYISAEDKKIIETLCGQKD